MDLFEERSSSYLSHKRELSEFLESESLDYASRIRRMLAARQSRLLVDINDIQRFSTELHRRLLTLPTHYYAPFVAALKEAVRLQAAPAELVSDNQHELEHSIGFEGHFGERRMTPRQLQAHHLGQLVCVEGIATKCQRSSSRRRRSAQQQPMLCRLILLPSPPLSCFTVLRLHRPSQGGVDCPPLPPS